jgi:hypothetical protein
VKKNLSIKVYQKDWIPGFGGYIAGSVNKPHAEILLNLGSFLLMIKNKQITKKELPYFIMEVMAHEMTHVLEDWAKQEFNHKKINALMKKYEKIYNQPKGEK